MGILLAAVVWLLIAAGIAVAYRLFLRPAVDRRLRDQTGSESRYRETVTLALDSFSGYAVFRSDTMADVLRRGGIRLDIVDDDADYLGRIESLRRGDVDMAVFTVDSLVTAGAHIGEFPASIVMVIDETRGADAMIAYRQGVASLQDLNHPEARIVLTPSSPSEFLARIAIAHFNLPLLPDPWAIEADGAGDVYATFRGASPSDRRAYVLWEPFVSRALEESGAVVLLDSSKLQGYIVDVLVAQREFLAEEPELVQAMVEAYLRALYEINTGAGLTELVAQDARKTGLRGLSREQVERLTQGVAWKNTLENFAHFGLLRESDAKGLPHIEDIIDQIIDVLVKTGALREDPLEGRSHTLFYKNVLRDLKTGGFHPGRDLNLLPGTGVATDAGEQVRGVAQLPALSQAEWDELVPVGEMRIHSLSFARGTARLNISSRRVLTELAAKLKSFPTYYLHVEGNARADGDVDANVALAQARAEAAVDFLVAEGLNPNRVRAVAARPTERGGEAQSVSFFVCQRPY
jgi:ABC-type nitrate/sulfonate/bicarbonate transport system substrate-binding protein